MTSVVNAKPLVSIVVTCHNYGQYLTECIESAIGQGEVIVVDDGSTDNTREVCGEWIGDNNFSYMYQENKGLPSARNTGIKAARGKYIIPLDADDTLYPEFVEKTLPLMPAIARTGLKCFGENDCVLPPSPYVTKADLLVNNQIFGTSMFPKEAWEKVGGYDEHMKAFEDWDFWIRMTDVLDIKTIEEPLFNYRIHKDSMTGQMNSNDREELKQYIRDKYK